LKCKIFLCVLSDDEMIHQQISNTRLSKNEIDQLLHAGLEGEFSNQRVLVLIPDHTRSLPLPMFFRSLIEVLHDVNQLDFMVALGTHPPLDENSLLRLVGITAEERDTKFRTIGLLNHAWDDPAVLETIGIITQDEVKQIAGERWHPSLGGDLPVRINKTVFDYDHILILGPTFPHEVVGFSGGAKYLFPGISGPEMIHRTHWLGALAGVRNTIGIIDTPVRAMIHAAAGYLKTPLTLISLVVEGEGVTGMFIGDQISAWRAAAELSSERHILWFDKPFRRVLSSAPPMYDELWTAAKAMYKLDPVVADGGEVIIYAPHLKEVSHTHGKYIYEVGYHVLDYFLNQWDKYKHIPLGVLAHSTHLRGDGSYEEGQEHTRVKVTLSSQISEEDCAHLSLGYLNPADVRKHEWEDREREGVLYVSKAGEMLYRVRKEKLA
jgi:nickel-dependent lactate racemase